MAPESPHMPEVTSQRLCVCQVIASAHLRKFREVWAKCRLRLPIFFPLDLIMKSLSRRSHAVCKSLKSINLE